MSPRYTVSRGSEIEFGGWLVLDENGGMRLSRGEPTTGRGERALRLSVTVPKSIFRVPTLVAKVKLDESAAPHTIEAEVQAKAEEALRGAFGCAVHISVGEP